MAKLFFLPQVPAAGSTPSTARFAEGDYLALAKSFQERRFPHGLRWAQEAWWGLGSENIWQKQDDLVFRSAAYDFIAGERWQKGRKAVAIPTGRATVDNLLDALKAAVDLGAPEPFPGIALMDGAINPFTREVSPFAAEQFVTWTLPFSSGRVISARPENWLAFLAEGNSEADISILQQWFGYCLFGGNRMQKTLWLYGPPGCGKSIICKILVALLAPERVAVRKAESFRSRFNDDLSEKRLVYFPDYRNSANDAKAALDFLLTVGGDDPILIEGKHKKPYTARLNVKILFTSNEMPMFRDTTHAALRRLMLVHRRAFNGVVNDQLEEILLAELPAIFSWALDGAKNLLTAGKFTTELLDQKLIRYTARATNATFAFLSDAVLFGEKDAQISKLEVFQAWRRYATERGEFQRFNYEGFVVSFLLSAKAIDEGVRADEDNFYGVSVRGRYLTPTLDDRG